MSVKLGHFDLHDQIGQGGMGTVFRAFDPSLNRNVAIKLLDEDLAKDDKFVEEFLREAQNAAAISHPQIVQIYFVGEQEGNYYLVMELLQGRSLSAMVEQDGPLPEPLALSIAIEISEALKAAYSNQMIHGDVKPQNIFVTNENGAKLLDFGLAKLANMEVAQSDGVWGSAYYVSPERIGQKAEDFRSDIYSLGATIFEALTGRPPFDAETVEELASKRLLEKPPLLRTLNPNISKRTESIINKMLAKSPLLRYLDYDSLINELRKAQSALLGNAPMTDTSELLRSTGQIPVMVTRKSQMPLVIIVSVAACIAAGAALYVFLHKEKPAPVPVVVNTPAPQPTPSATATPLPTPYGTKIVYFHYPGSGTKSVLITGNFDQWHPEPMTMDKSGTWSIAKELPRQVALEYQFIVDGKRVPDPMRPQQAVPDEHGDLKSVYIIPKDEPTPTAKPTQKPKPTATPRPTPSQTPNPTPTTTPTPNPDIVDMKALASSPSQWPRTVVLKQSVPFPAVINGKLSGEIEVSAGMQVNLVNVTPNELTLDFQGSTQKVPVSATDLIERVKAARHH
jgi:serine/threonine protein kinase